MSIDGRDPFALGGRQDDAEPPAENRFIWHTAEGLILHPSVDPEAEEFYLG
jgi:hypothetical protein